MVFIVTKLCKFWCSICLCLTKSSYACDFQNSDHRFWQLQKNGLLFLMLVAKQPLTLILCPMKEWMTPGWILEKTLWMVGHQCLWLGAWFVWTILVMILLQLHQSPLFLYITNNGLNIGLEITLEIDLALKLE